MDVTGVADVVPNGHLGLVLVRDAVAEMGGEVGIRSAAGAGTTIEVRVPLR